jgi:hypothetical protein
MPKTASVKLARPTTAGQVLKVTGYCPAAVLAKGPLEVSFRVDAVTIGKVALTRAEQFEFKFPLPSELEGGSMMEIEIEVSRTTQVARDPRVFGLTFGTFTLE